METHLIELEEDFLGLQEYIKENNYKHLIPSCKAYSILQDKNYASAIEFAFDDHETFVVSLPKRELQENACKWVASFIPKKEDNTDLIFGKDRTERIVGCEVENNQIELFIEKEDGTIESKFMFNEYWILSCIKHDSTWQKLQGQQYYRFIKKYTDRNEFEEDRKRLKKYKVYSIYDPKEAAMVLNGFTYFKGMQVHQASVLSFDLETTGVDLDSSAKILLISNTFRKRGRIIKKLFSYDEYGNQGEMLDDWCRWVRECNPSILLGHNVFCFDFRYLQHVADLEGTSLRLGRDGSPIRFNNYESRFRKDGSQFYLYNKAYIYGREIIDTLFLSYKYDLGRKYESYGLKAIASYEYEDALHKIETGENLSPLYQQFVENQKKRTFYDASQIRYNYKNPSEWEKIKAYCIDDSDDALFLFDLMIPAFFYMTQSIPKSFQEINCSATGSQINAMLVRSYLQMGWSIPRETDTEPYEGAISFGNPGLYKYLKKFDISSLYPSCILQYEIYDKFKDPFKHFLKMVEHFTKGRLTNKELAKKTGEQYFKDLSESQKTLINSCYGMLAAMVQFNSPKNAALITRKGREILEFCIWWATGKTYSGNDDIDTKNITPHDFILGPVDTDSISFSKKDMTEFTQEEQDHLLNELNSYLPEKIKMADDGYFKACLVVKAKNYVLQYIDGRVKIKGSALKATTKPKALQQYIRDVINLLLEDKKDEIINIYHKYIKDVLNLNDITPWCSKRTITNKVLNAERTNEQKVLDAIEGMEQKQEGTKIYTYFTPDGSLKLRENWNKDHDPYKLIEGLYKTSEVLEPVIDLNKFIKYHLKTKRKLLDLI